MSETEPVKIGFLPAATLLCGLSVGLGWVTGQYRHGPPTGDVATIGVALLAVVLVLSLTALMGRRRRLHGAGIALAALASTVLAGPVIAYYLPFWFGGGFVVLLASLGGSSPLSPNIPGALAFLGAGALGIGFFLFNGWALYRASGLLGIGQEGDGKEGDGKEGGGAQPGRPELTPSAPPNTALARTGASSGDVARLSRSDLPTRQGSSTKEAPLSEDFKRAAARAALAEIEPGMRIGLGTGSTAAHFVDLLGEKVARGFDCLCVPTSEATAAQARALGIPLADLDDALDALDVTVDGADELDGALRLVKGGGAALLREKIVAAASARMVVIADISKRVETLGRFPLPVEVNPFGLKATARAVRRVMEEAGAEGGLALRKRPDGAPLLTDGGHHILDASFGRISDAEGVSRALHAVPGVVEHGLFLDLCHAAYLAGPHGVVRLPEGTAQ